MPNQIHHNRLILLSQLLLLVLICALAWQGISAARTQDRMVRGLLDDYAELIAENAERSLNQALGYRTFYRLLQSLQSQQSLFPVDELWPSDVFDTALDLPVSPKHFRIVALRDLANSTATVLWQSTQANFPASWERMLPDIPRRDPTSGGFRILHPELGQHNETVMSVLIPATEKELLIWFSPAMIAEKTELALRDATLLPAVLGDPERLRPHIKLSISSPDGSVLWASQAWSSAEPGRSLIMDGDYSGLMAGFTIQASLKPEVAGELVLGGLPYGRLPFIIALLVVALGLGAMSFYFTRSQREINELRNDFVARVSHELRTPLTQIRMFAESMLHDRISSEQDRHEALQVINRETLRLGNMVDSILSFERPSPHSPPPEQTPYSLAKWADSLATRFQPLLEAGNSSLAHDIPRDATSLCNRDALTQICGNLLDNALKYGPAGQKIQICYLEHDRQWQLQFHDEGPGIPADRLESIFEPYSRLDRDRKNGTTGTGIGLSVAREIAISMGGNLGYELNNDHGCFVLGMPRDTPDE